MKITQADVVYRHKATGVAYTMEHAIVPIAIMGESDEPARFGVLLKPYGDHPDIDWDDWSREYDSDELLGKYGFLPNRYGQWIVVEESKLETDFECLGTLKKELDLEELTRHYKEERCSFSNKEHLAQAVIRRLAESGPSLWTCQLYAVLKGFLGTKKA